MGMDCPYSSSEQWKPLAQAILADDRNLTLNPIPGNFYRYRHASIQIWKEGSYGSFGGCTRI
jgi:hypothetical protein